jgi:tetratricopeptide (TPR) repeat protein
MRRKFQVSFVAAVLLGAFGAGIGCNKLRARDQLNKGVEAYKNARFDVAIEDFKNARELDPTLTSAQLYLAAAYANQYIPGAPSPENLRNADSAIQVYKEILQGDPNNLPAIDGIGSLLYNMGTTPFDENKLTEAKSYHEKHIQISPNDPEPYYWVGVIDWALAYRGNRDARDGYNRTANPKRQIKENDPLPEKLRTQFTDKYGQTVDEGISDLQKAISLKPDYDDAMAYLNLMYRQKADMEATKEAREGDLKKADQLVEQVKAIKQKKAGTQPS